MNISRMHSEVKLRFNDFNTNKNIDLNPAYIDDVLNEVISYYVEMFYAGNNLKNFKLGFEVTQQRIDMLSTLVIGPLDQPLITPTNETADGLYQFDLSGLKYKYRHLLRGMCQTDCGLVGISLVQHDDLNLALLRDKHQGPSRKWRRVLGVVTKSASSEQPALNVYTNNELSILSAQFDYIKEPKKVFIGGYDTLEYIRGDLNALNNTSDPVDCDLPEAYHNLVIDLAVQQLSRIFEEPNKNVLHTEKVTNY